MHSHLLKNLLTNFVSLLLAHFKGNKVFYTIYDVPKIAVFFNDVCTGNVPIIDYVLIKITIKLAHRPFTYSHGIEQDAYCSYFLLLNPTIGTAILHIRNLSDL